MVEKVKYRTLVQVRPLPVLKLVFLFSEFERPRLVLLAVLQLEEQADDLAIYSSLERDAIIRNQLPHERIGLVRWYDVARVETTIHGLLHLLGGELLVLLDAAQCCFDLTAVVTEGFDTFSPQYRMGFHHRCTLLTQLV